MSEKKAERNGTRRVFEAAKMAERQRRGAINWRNRQKVAQGQLIKMRESGRGRAIRQKTVKGGGDLGEATDCERIPIKKILVHFSALRRL